MNNVELFVPFGLIIWITATSCMNAPTRQQLHKQQLHKPIKSRYKVVEETKSRNSHSQPIRYQKTTIRNNNEMY